MKRSARSFLGMSLFCLGYLSLAAVPSSLWARKADFAPRELFRVPFGQGKADLGAEIVGESIRIPRRFTRDAEGHFYIDDVNHHRIARFSSAGAYEMEYRYLPTARQVFAHADSQGKLWLFMTDPAQGFFYGVYNSSGKNLRSAVFSRYDRYRLHVDDSGTLHILLSSDRFAERSAIYFLDEKSLLMKKENVGPPPEGHHRLRRSERLYLMDALPGSRTPHSPTVTRITDSQGRHSTDIQGDVIFITDRGEIYTRVGQRTIQVYDVNGALLGQVRLTGLASSCEAVRFDEDGNIYQLDGIPDQLGQATKTPSYSSAMSGMRLIQWQRQ